MTAAITASIVIPCHNAAAFLEDALQSVQQQTLSNFECILIDDASTDETGTIARRFEQSDPRFKLITMSHHHGASAARNAALAIATGRWIALLDADDLYRPDRLERLTRIGDGESADMVVDDQVVTTFPSTTSTHRAFGFTQSMFAFTQENFFCGSRLFRRSFAMGYMKPLIRREFLSRSKVVYDPSVLSGEDFLFYAHLFAALPRCIGTSFAGYIYRRRRGSLSRSDTHMRLHAQLGDRVLSEFGPQLSSRSRAALAGRRRDLEQLTCALPALGALRQRDWSSLVRLLVKEPRAVVTCLRLGRRSALRSWSALTGRRGGEFACR